MMLKRALQNEDTRHTHKNWSNHLERGGGVKPPVPLYQEEKIIETLKKLTSFLTQANLAEYSS